MGVFLYLAPLALAAITLVFVVTVGFTRFISLGSITGAITFPLAVWLIQRPPIPVLVAGVICSALVLYRHRENMRRLHEGTENPFALGRGRP